MRLIHDHKATLTQQRGMVVCLRFLGHEVHIMVCNLKVQVGKVVHPFSKFVVCTFLLSRTACACTLNTDSALNRSADAVSVQVNSCMQVAQLLECFNGGLVFFGIHTDILEKVIETITAKVVFLAFAKYRGQRTLDNVIV